MRFRWLIVGATLLGAGGGAAAWNLVTPTYTTTASLWIQSGGGVQGQNQGPIATGQLLRSESWVDLMRSFAVLDTVVMQQKLFLTLPDPMYAPAFEAFGLDERFVPGSYELHISESGESLELFRDGFVVERTGANQPIGSAVGFRWTPPGELLPGEATIEFAVQTPRQASVSLRDDMRAQLDRNATFISVALPGRDPEKIAAVLNAILEREVELAAELKAADLLERTSVLDAQLATVEAELRNAERALESFRVNTITLPSDAPIPIQPGLQSTTAPVISGFFAMNLRLEELRQDRLALERILAALPDSGLRVEALELIPAVGTSSQLASAVGELTTARVELRVLRQRYTDAHQDVQDAGERVRELESEAVPRLVAALAQQLREDEARMQDRIDSSGEDLSDIPTRTIEEARLQRRVDIADGSYADLRGRYQAASLAAASSIPDIRILDRALPPVSPDVDTRLRAALMVLLAGLGLGVGGAVLLDRADTRIQYASDVTDALGLEILGAVPRMLADTKAGPDASRQALEAFRELRLNLEYAYGAAGPIVLTISSPDQHEGKSTVTANLAVGFAAVGRKTLVIDGDTRKGNLHRMLEAERTPGLTDFLMGHATKDEIVQRTKIERVRMVGSGSRSQTSPELLASGRLGALLGEFRNDYDVILVDSPPLGAGADALVLSTLTGHLALVLRSGQTNVAYAEAKLAALQRLPVRVLGVILNDFAGGGGKAQGYYAYTDYIDGYAATDEEDDEPIEDPSRILT